MGNDLDRLNRAIAASNEAAAQQKADERAFEMQNFLDSPEMRKKLRQGFAEEMGGAMAAINTAHAAGDFAAAARVAHTAKGMADLIGERALADAAVIAERNLKGGGWPQEALTVMEGELARTLGEIRAEYS